MKKRHSEEQIIRIFRGAELHSVPIRDLCKQHNISEQTFCRWRDQYGEMEMPDARRFEDLEAENARRKRLVAVGADMHHDYAPRWADRGDGRADGHASDSAADWRQCHDDCHVGPEFASGACGRRSYNRASSTCRRMRN